MLGSRTVTLDNSDMKRAEGTPSRQMLCSWDRVGRRMSAVWDES